MNTYATIFLEHCPEDATQFFIDYYTGKFKPKKDAVVVMQSSPSNTEGYGTRAVSAVQSLAAMLPLPYMSASSSAPPSQNREAASMTQIVETINSDEPPAEYPRPKPRSAFSSFVDHPELLRRFLEACIALDDWSTEDRADLYTTLFQLYIDAAQSHKDDVERLSWESKAKALIEGDMVPIDTSNVLLLSHLNNYREGTVLVREKQGLHFDIFRSYTTAKDTQGAIKALHKYGSQEPGLYSAALAYFTSSPDVLAEAGDELNVVLKRIDEEGLMAPLQVIQTLSANGVATMGMIKAYLSKTVERERQEISQNQRLIDTYRNDTEKKRLDMQSVVNKPTTFNATRCSSCALQLDLPTVHFLCKHSFHQRCLNTPDSMTPSGGAAIPMRRGEVSSTSFYRGAEDEAGVEGEDVECPLCAASNATIKAIRKAQEESAARHDLFLDALQRSRDRFGTIAEWFGRGVMGAETR